MADRADLASRLVHFTARLSTLLPWLEAQHQALSSGQRGGLRDSIETVVALAHQVHHVYEPFVRPSPPHTARARRREVLANQLTGDLEQWSAKAGPERRIVADFWRLTAALIWCTTSHNQYLRARVGIADSVGAETLRQHRFSTQNVHEAWALATEGFYDPAAVEETTKWLLLHVRDSARRDYRIALLSKAPAVGTTAEPLGDPALSAPSLGGLSLGPDSVMMTHHPFDSAPQDFEDDN